LSQPGLLTEGWYPAAVQVIEHDWLEDEMRREIFKPETWKGSKFLPERMIVAHQAPA
jgi:hypothetical protein